MFKVETFSPTLALPCVASWSSLHRRRDLRRGMTSSKYSPVDVSSEFVGEGRLVEWRDRSVWIIAFLFKDVNKEM